MVKAGILHDYDLMANAEPSAQNNKCAGCDAAPMTFQWSDYSGEGMCTRCGCPYQLKWGSKEMRAEGKYPYLNLRDELVESLRAYFAETSRFTCLGMMLGPRPGLKEFDEWMEINRSELLAKLRRERSEEKAG